jgi:hypothetical protein
MKAEFYDAADEEATTMATAVWDGGNVTIVCDDRGLRETLEHAFRPTPIVTDDPSLRRFGTSGESVLQPGSLEWFRAAALYRATVESGFQVRFVTGVTEGGYDPAANYRRFDDQIERLTARGSGT